MEVEAMIKMEARCEDDARIEAIAISKENPGKYVIVALAFGAFACLSDRLNVFAPTDTPFNWYVLNGRLKTFTQAQVIADQNATPMMS